MSEDLIARQIRERTREVIIPLYVALNLKKILTDIADAVRENSSDKGGIDGLDEETQKAYRQLCDDVTVLAGAIETTKAQQLRILPPQVPQPSGKLKINLSPRLDGKDE